MSTKEQLLQEIEQSPDYLIEEVLNFMLFLKLRLKQRLTQNTHLETSTTQTNSMYHATQAILESKGINP